MLLIESVSPFIPIICFFYFAIQLLFNIFFAQITRLFHKASTWKVNPKRVARIIVDFSSTHWNQKITALSPILNKYRLELMWCDATSKFYFPPYKITLKIDSRIKYRSFVCFWNVENIIFKLNWSQILKMEKLLEQNFEISFVKIYSKLFLKQSLKH